MYEQMPINCEYSQALLHEALTAVNRIQEYLPEGQNHIDTGYYPWTNDELAIRACFTRNQPRPSSVVLLIRPRGHSQEKPQSLAIIDSGRSPAAIAIKCLCPDFDQDEVLARVKYVAYRYTAEQEFIKEQSATPYWRR